MSENQTGGRLEINLDVISGELHVRPEILKKIITSFAGTLAVKLAELATACSKDDVARARAILHEVRGTSGNLRLEKVYVTARALHEAVKAGQEKVKILEYLESLKARSAELTDVVSRWGK